MSMAGPPDSDTPTAQPVGPRRWRRARRLLVLALVLVAAVIAVFGCRFAGRYRAYVSAPEPGLTETIVVEIRPGMNFKQIARLLEERGVVSNLFYFEVLAHRKNVTRRMQAGEYFFKPGFTPLQILDIISRGDVAVWKLVVPEGFDIFDIARRLAGLGSWSEDKFLEVAQSLAKAAALGIPEASVEGYLFPAVYDLRLSMTEEQVIDLMAARAEMEKTQARLARAQEIGLSWHEVLTLASMVEKETPDRDEMPLIAGVFMKRLGMKMPLQSDPTAVYGLRDFKGPITKRDLVRPGPYNTYLHRGLPPGPICSPGADAIDAALHPADTDYLYFYARGDGSHEFAESYLEHVNNIRKRRRGD